MTGRCLRFPVGGALGQRQGEPSHLFGGVETSGVVGDPCRPGGEAGGGRLKGAVGAGERGL